jgi:primosomal protein N'
MRHETEYGIVVGRRESAPEGMEIRDIVRVVTLAPLLAPYQIALILEIGAKYLIPIHRVLGFFVSKWVLKRLEKKNFEQLDSETDEQSKISRRSSQIQTNSVEMTENKLTILKDSIITGDILKNFLKPSTVVICPDDFTLYRLEAELADMDIFYLPWESTDTRKAQSWIDIKNHEYDIIVWNRKILYYNLSAYTNIIYLEDAFGREYFHYPIRIEYIDIFDMIDKQSRFALQILTSAPRLTTLTRFRHFQFQNI